MVEKARIVSEKQKQRKLLGKADTSRAHMMRFLGCLSLLCTLATLSFRDVNSLPDTLCAILCEVVSSEYGKVTTISRGSVGVHRFSRSILIRVHIRHHFFFKMS